MSNVVQMKSWKLVQVALFWKDSVKFWKDMVESSHDDDVKELARQALADANFQYAAATGRVVDDIRAFPDPLLSLVEKAVLKGGLDAAVAGYPHTPQEQPEDNGLEEHERLGMKSPRGEP